MGNSIIGLRGFYNPDLAPPKKKRIRKGKKAKSRRNRAEDRAKARNMLGLHEHAPLSGICLAIHNETGWGIAETNAQRQAAIRRYIREGEKRKREYSPDYIASDEFYKSSEWKALRYTALKMAEGRCACCGARASDGVQIHVDHIIPRSVDPRKALDLANLQLLCEDCNFGKGNFDATDWR